MLLGFSINQSTVEATQPTVYQDCDSGLGCGCKRQRTKRCCRCPKCQTDVCKLKVEKTKEKRTCFKTEQKIICIPTIRLPWQKCQPQCAKTRTVTVLKKHKYECPKCKYTWELCEPEIAQPNQETLPMDAYSTHQYQQPMFEYEQPMLEGGQILQGQPQSLDTMPVPPQPPQEPQLFNPAGNVPQAPNGK